MNSASIHATVRPRAVLISPRKIESMKGYANSKGVRTGRTQRVAFTVETCPVETRLELPTAQVRLRRSKPQEHDVERATTCLAAGRPSLRGRRLAHPTSEGSRVCLGLARSREPYPRPTLRAAYPKSCGFRVYQALCVAVGVEGQDPVKPHSFGSNRCRRPCAITDRRSPAGTS